MLPLPLGTILASTPFPDAATRDGFVTFEGELDPGAETTPAAGREYDLLGGPLGGSPT